MEALVDKKADRKKKRGKLVEFRGEQRILSDLSKEHGLDPTIVYRRLRRGWDLERAITTPTGYVRPWKARPRYEEDLAPVRDSIGTRIIERTKRKLVVGEYYRLPRPYIKKENGEIKDNRYKLVSLMPYFAVFESHAGFRICFRYFDLARLLQREATL